MDLDFEKIRAVFSKGSVVTTPENMVVVYNDKDRWVSQDFEGAGISALIDLLKSCEGFSIAIKEKESIKLIFIGCYKSDNTVFYPALKRQLSLEEFKEIMDEYGNKDAQERFEEFFVGVDLSDEEALIARFEEWMDGFKRSSNIINLPAYERWKKMLGYLSAIQTKGFFNDTEFQNPDDGFDGCITIHLDSESVLPAIFPQEIKDLFTKLIENSSVFGIECHAPSGYLNIDFYA